MGNISLHNIVYHHRVLIKYELAEKFPISNNKYVPLNACFAMKQNFHSCPKQNTFKPNTNPSTQKPINDYLSHGLHKIN